MAIVLPDLGLLLPINVWSGSCRRTLVVGGDDRFEDRGFCALVLDSRGCIDANIEVHIGRFPVIQSDHKPIVDHSNRGATLSMNTLNLSLAQYG